MTAEEIQKLIQQRAAVAGVPAAPFLAMAKNESSYGQAANRKGSQYQGVMQMGKAASDTVGLDRRLVNDPTANIDAAIRLAKKNSAYLGVPISQENAGIIYAAHQQGAGAVKKWLQASPDTPIANIITAKRANANGMAGMTVAQAKAKWIDGTQKLADRWAGVASKQEDNALLIASGESVPNPTNQTSAVGGYNQQMLDAAQKIADNNLAAVNNFGWNPTVQDSSAQLFGKSVQGVTNAQTNIANAQLQALSRNNPDGSRKSLGEYAYDHILGARSENINSRALAKIQAEQSTTGKAMADQVANMKVAMDGTVINPAVLDKAATNLTQQQQVENQTYNVVTDNANAQKRYELDKSNSEVNNRLATERADREKAEYEAVQAAKNKAVEQQAALQPAIQEAATAMGISIPQGMSYNDAVALVPEAQRTEFVTRIANQNRAANSFYDAVIVGQSPYATDAQRRVAAGGESLVRSILSTEGAQQAVNAEPTAEGKERVRRALVQDALDRASFGEASSKEFNTVANNPYSLNNRGEEFFKDIPPLKGVTNPADFRDIFATILNSSDAGATSAEIASTISAISNKLNATNKANGLPLPPARLHVKYLSNVYDVTKPVDVAKLRHAMGREAGDENSITGFIRRRIAEGAGLADKVTPFFTPITTNTSDQRSRADFGKIPQ